MPDRVPDSRLQNGQSIKGIVSGINPADPHQTRQNFVPIFCFSCGTFRGYVDERTWALEQDRGCVGFLCDPCSEKYGYDANFLLMPDEILWQGRAEDEVARMLHEIEKGNLEGA